MRYRITQLERWIRTAVVEATSPEDALDKLCDGETIADETEYDSITATEIEEIHMPKKRKKPIKKSDRKTEAKYEAWKVPAWRKALQGHFQHVR